MPPAYVSRAGAKLAAALDYFTVNPWGLVCADLGCSTGGFTDCLLQRGATRVYAVDTGYGVLDYRLRRDPRVVVMERTNALHLQLNPVDLMVVDVGWTPQRLILPAAWPYIVAGGQLISLLKPHYEASPHMRKRGVVPPEILSQVISQVLGQLRDLGFVPQAVLESPVKGEKGGNTEYLLYFIKPLSVGRL